MVVCNRPLDRELIQHAAKAQRRARYRVVDAEAEVGADGQPVLLCAYVKCQRRIAKTEKDGVHCGFVALCVGWLLA